MSRIRLLLGIILAQILVLSPATAAIIFDNGLPDNANAYLSDNALPGSPVAQRSGSAAFVLGPGSKLLTKVTWYGAYGQGDLDNKVNPLGGPIPAADSFTIQLFNFTGGIPEVSPFYSVPVTLETRTATTYNIGGSFPIYKYEFSLPSVLLASGTYLLSIVNDTGGSLGADWLWATSGGGTATAYFRSGVLGTPVPWTAIPGETLAFQLEGEMIPAPWTGALLLFGFLFVPLFQSRPRRSG